jgi:hypothetical protein
MKKLKNTKKMQNEILEFQEVINNYCSKINKEYAKNMNKLIENIAKGENLDINILKEKYFKTLDLDEKEEQSDIEIKPLNEEVKTDNESEVDTNININIKESEINTFEEIIFDKIIIDGTNYYYENKQDGKIYDSSSKIVGVYKNKMFVIN